MTTKKSIWVLFGILVISAWVLGSAIQAGAETMNFKAYSVVVKVEVAPIGDVEDHVMGLQTRRGFSLFENGEVGSNFTIVMGGVHQRGWIKYILLNNYFCRWFYHYDKTSNDGCRIWRSLGCRRT